MTTTNTYPKPEINEWTRPGTDETRRYISNWQEVLGIEREYYKNGNLYSATMNGEKISNRQASFTCVGKVWIDKDDRLHLDYHQDSNLITVEEKRELLVKRLCESGIKVS